MNQIVVVPIDQLTNIVQNAVRAALEQLPQTQSSPEKSDRVLLPEACEITGLSKSKIYKLVMVNSIPVSKFGDSRKLIFSRTALITWMDEQTKPVISTSDLMVHRLSKKARKSSK